MENSLEFIDQKILLWIGNLSLVFCETIKMLINVDNIEDSMENSLGFIDQNILILYIFVKQWKCW